MTTVGIVYDDLGDVVDEVFNTESGITYANEGYYVHAVAPDGSFSIERVQQFFDHELDLAVDCFGCTDPREQFTDTQWERIRS